MLKLSASRRVLRRTARKNDQQAKGNCHVQNVARVHRRRPDRPRRPRLCADGRAASARHARPPWLKPAAAPAAALAPLLDINSASQEELQALKGVGDVRAKAIIAGRPYKGKDELWQKKIVPKGVYKGIQNQIIAKQK